MQRSCEEGSTQWRAEPPQRTPPATRPRLRTPDRERRSVRASQTERALRLVYASILPRMVADEARIRARLGYARPTYDRQMERTHLFFVQIAAEMGEWWLEVRRRAESASVPRELRRIERQHMEDAAGDLLEAISRLPAPVRQVVERRACGHSWRRMARDLPGRAIFSMTDDWEAALRVLESRHGDTISRLV